MTDGWPHPRMRSRIAFGGDYNPEQWSLEKWREDIALMREAGVSMVTIGLLQYFAPVLQFIVALVVFREAMTPERWIGFGVVWLALLLLTADMLRTARRNAVTRRLARAAA